MALYSLYTNYFCDRDKQKLLEELNKGNAVSVSSNCIGHTRAAMIKAQGEKYLESLGCVVVGEDLMETKQYKLLKKTN